MVVFTCQKCGDSVKKTVVDKHKFKCGNSLVLTCVDCFKDFRNDEHVGHTSCITESERYGGLNYKPRPMAVKQNEWLQICRTILDKGNFNYSESRLLETISSMQNVPRVEKKFLNFVKNVSKNTTMNVALRVFRAVSEAYKKEKQEAEGKGTVTTGGDAAEAGEGAAGTEENFEKQRNKKKRKHEEGDKGGEGLNRKELKRLRQEAKREGVEEESEMPNGVENGVSTVNGELSRKKKKKKKGKQEDGGNMGQEESKELEPEVEVNGREEEDGGGEEESNELGNTGIGEHEDGRNRVAGSPKVQDRGLSRKELKKLRREAKREGVVEEESEMPNGVENGVPTENGELSRKKKKKKKGKQEDGGNMGQEESKELEPEVEVNGREEEDGGGEEESNELGNTGVGEHEDGRNRVAGSPEVQDRGLSRKEKKRLAKRLKYEAEMRAVANGGDQGDEEGGGEPGEEAEGRPKKEKKKKKEKRTVDIASEELTADTEPNIIKLEDETVAEKPTGKFDWEQVIVAVLSASSDREMSLKRLMKKVVSEYQYQKETNDYEAAAAKFNKKIHKTPGVRVIKEKAKLIAS